MRRPHPSPRTAVVGVLLAVVALLLVAPPGASARGTHGDASVSHGRDHSGVSAAVAPSHRVVSAKRLADVTPVDAPERTGVPLTGVSAPAPATAAGPAPARGSPARDRAPPA